MSNMREPVLKAVADVVKDHVGKAFGVLRGRIDGVEAAFKALPKPERGEPGIDGQKGADGVPGIPGEPGVGGTAGVDGKDGRDGIDGAKGNDGAAGKDAQPVDVEALAQKVLALVPVPKNGEPGKDAEPINFDAVVTAAAATVMSKIPTPKDGAPGKDGKDGLDGEPGKDGEKSLDGKDGLPGLKGLDGKDGRDGSDGKDATPVDAKALGDEIIEKVLGQIPAPVHGKDGRDGRDAEQLDVNDIVSKIIGQIPPPIPGKDGKDVDAEALSVRIASEVSKAIAALPKPAAGRDGRDGRAGEQGESGKDAAEYDILNGMDESASYQHGVYVKHRNGIFRAYRTTDPVIDKNYEAAGWMCTQSNIVDIVESLAPDQRTVIKTHEFSDGSIITSKYKSTALLDRGVWKEATEYEQGDSVTVAGSLWIAQEITQDRPGISKAWRLAVKRGSDGKDLRPRDENAPPLNGKGSVYLGAKR